MNYPDDAFQFPEELVQALVRGQAVTVIGAGVSAGCRNTAGEHPPSWKLLLETLAKDQDDGIRAAVDKLIAHENYLTAAEILWERDKHAVITLLETEFIHKGYKHCEVHTHLAELWQNVYITPNYDTLFDTYMKSRGDIGVTVKNQTQSDIIRAIRQATVVIIKAHGTIDHSDSLVFTRRQYAEQRVKNSAFYDVVDALFLTRTVLFVGCGTSDPDFQLLLEDAALNFPDAPCHYMISQFDANRRIIDESIEKLRNLKFIYYDGPHSLLPELTNLLQAEVNGRRASGLP